MIEQMTPAQYNEATSRHGYTKQSFAVAVGASPRTGEKWGFGERRIPGCVAVLLALLDERPELRDVIDKIGAPTTRARGGG